MAKNSGHSFTHILVSTERDALGLDASSLRRLHADILGASERAQARGLDALGAKAGAPRPAGAGAPSAPRSSPAAWRLDVARAGVEDVAPREGGSDGVTVGSWESAAADAAEIAWLIKTPPPSLSSA